MQRTIVLLGHEHNGIPDSLVESADACVEIPMVGQGASLNVAVAGSLVLYRLAGLTDWRYRQGEPSGYSPGRTKPVS